ARLRAGRRARLRARAAGPRRLGRGRAALLRQGRRDRRQRARALELDLLLEIAEQLVERRHLLLRVARRLDLVEDHVHGRVAALALFVVGHRPRRRLGGSSTIRHRPREREGELRTVGPRGGGRAPPPRGGSGRVEGELLELLLELLLRARLELAGALARDAELAAERCERDLLVAHEALLEDEALSLVEPLERVAEVALDQAAALLVEV